jgi:hypothetical protein
VVRAAPFALLTNTRKTERGAKHFSTPGGTRRTLCASNKHAQNGARRKTLLNPWSVRAAPFALLRNTRKTERGAGEVPEKFGAASRTLCASTFFLSTFFFRHSSFDILPSA